MSRSAPLFTKPRAGKLSPNKSGHKSKALDVGAKRDVDAGANGFWRKRQRADPVRGWTGVRA